MSNHYKNVYGIIYAFLYCLMSAISMVLIGHYEQNISPFKLSFYTFLIAALFFNVLVVPKYAQFANKIKPHDKLILLINIATVTAWITTFYSLKFVEPSVVIAIIFGIIPVASILFSLKQASVKNLHKQDVLFAALIALVVTMIIVYYVFVSYHLPIAIRYPIYLSLFLAVVSGVGTAWCMVYMKALSLHGFSAMQVMSMRFFLMIFLTALLMWHDQMTFSLNRADFLIVTLVAFLTAILPLFLFQKGIENTTPVNISFIMPLQPVITYALQMIEGRFNLSLPLLSLIILLSITILISAYYKTHRTISGK